VGSVEGIPGDASTLINLRPHEEERKRTDQTDKM
jgi:hypothetical protein